MPRMLGLLVFLATISGAQDRNLRAPSVRASGEAVIYVKPDQARIDVGVVTQAPTAQTAASQNAAQTQAVVDKLRAALPRAEVKTISYSVSPNYQYPRDGGKPTISGYTAQNTVEVTTEVGDAGKLIDVVTQGGANQINRLQFTLKDEKPARADALRQAALEARANAEAMAAALGMKLGPVLLLEQGTPDVVRPMPVMRAQVASVATPVEPAAVEVHATVTITVALQ